MCCWYCILTPAGSHVRVVFTTVKSTLWQRTRIATPGIATGRATRANAFVVFLDCCAIKKQKCLFVGLC